MTVLAVFRINFGEVKIPSLLLQRMDEYRLFFGTILPTLVCLHCGICATTSAAAKYVINSDFIPSMASESKYGKADSELRSLLVGLSSDTLDGEKYFAVLNSSTVLRRSLSNFSLK